MNKAFLRLCAVLLLMLTACNEDKPQDGEGWGGPVEARVITPETRDVAEWDEYTGRFRASERVEIRARVSGYVEKVAFDDGQIVEEGAVLFVIDPRPFQIAVDSAQAGYDLAYKEFQRAEKLKKSRAISQEDYDIRLQNMRVAKATLDNAALELEFTQVKAPFKGRVSRNYIDKGNLISGGNASATLLTTLVSISPIEFYFEGSEADVLKYMRLYNNGERAGERGGSWPVYVKLQDEDSFMHEGIINFVDNELDVSTGTKEIRAVFDNKNGLLAPGLFGRLRITTTEKFKAFLVPDKVIGTEQTRKYVYVVGQENKATRQYLTLGGLDQDGMRIIRSGLDAKDLVIVGNLQKIQPGAVLEPVLEAQSTASKAETVSEPTSLAPESEQGE